MCRLSMARSATLLPPTTDRHRCAVLPPSYEIGLRELSISRCRRARLLPGFRIAPAACPLARSPVLQYVHSIRLCLGVNRVMRGMFEALQAPLPDAAARGFRGGCEPELETMNGSLQARAVQTATTDRPRRGAAWRHDVGISRTDTDAQRRHPPRTRPGRILRRHRAAPAAAMASHGE